MRVKCSILALKLEGAIHKEGRQSLTSESVPWAASTSLSQHHNHKEQDFLQPHEFGREPRALAESAIWLTPWFEFCKTWSRDPKTSDLQNNKLICECCFKPLSLVIFYAAERNYYTSPLQDEGIWFRFASVKNKTTGNSLAVHWLGFSAFTPKGLD